MKQIPILFSTPMVQAILAGRKTQTRRVVKPQPILPEPTSEIVRTIKIGWVVRHKIPSHPLGYEATSQLKCPYKVGDVLWVRETLEQNALGGAIYRAGGKVGEQIGHNPLAENEFLSWDDFSITRTVIPSIHMPKSACRIWLEITDVRVERLQDITVEDAIAEGIEKRSNNYQFKNYENENQLGFSQPRDSFQSLWKSINSEQSWNDNPWVWVIEFKRIENPNL